MGTLTAQERSKFADWLELEADEERKTVALMKSNNMPAQFIKNREYEIAASIIVARKLRSIEDETIG